MSLLALSRLRAKSAGWSLSDGKATHRHQPGDGAELSPQLMRIGMALRSALILGGTTYLQDLLFPMNFSNAWLEAKADLIGLATHRGWLINDVYALQNLMDSFLDFEPLTSQLGLIRVPTMIMSGEFDFLTRGRCRIRCVCKCPIAALSSSRAPNNSCRNWTR